MRLIRFSRTSFRCGWETETGIRIKRHHPLRRLLGACPQPPGILRSLPSQGHVWANSMVARGATTPSNPCRKGVLPTRRPLPEATGGRYGTAAILPCHAIGVKRKMPGVRGQRPRGGAVFQPQVRENRMSLILVPAGGRAGRICAICGFSNFFTCGGLQHVPSKSLPKEHDVTAL